MSESARPPAAAYIATARVDQIWIILCPLICFAFLAAIWRWSGLSDLSVYAILFAHPENPEAWKAVDAIFGHEEPRIRLIGVQSSYYQRGRNKKLTAALREYLQGAANDKDPKVAAEAKKLLKYRW